MASNSRKNRPRAEKRKSKPGSRGKPRASESEGHTIPIPVPSPALPRLMVEPAPEHEARQIREYVELEAPGEKVIHVEMVASERIFHQKHDVWDVHTDKHRWWVITSPTNLYLQRDFPSLDYILSFHVGLTARTFARQEKKSPADPEERDRLSAAWRRWEQAADDLDAAEEAEHFQAIGMRCRECLLEFVRSASKPEFIAAGQSAPARGDFIHWSEIIADGVARGGSAQDLRTLLKVTAKATWQFVS